jgi:hypothetical protein
VVRLVLFTDNTKITGATPGTDGTAVKRSQVIYAHQGQAEPEYDNDPEVQAIMQEKERQKALNGSRSMIQIKSSQPMNSSPK